MPAAQMMGLKTQRASFCRDYSSSTSWGPCAESTSASNLTFDESGELKLIPSFNTRYYRYFWIPFSFPDGCLRLDWGEKKMNLQRNRQTWGTGTSWGRVFLALNPPLWLDIGSGWNALFLFLLALKSRPHVHKMENEFQNLPLSPFHPFLSAVVLPLPFALSS